MKLDDVVQNKVYCSDAAVFLKLKDCDTYVIAGSYSTCRLHEGGLNEIESPCLFNLVISYHNAVLYNAWQEVKDGDPDLARQLADLWIIENIEWFAPPGVKKMNSAK